MLVAGARGDPPLPGPPQAEPAAAVEPHPAPRLAGDRPDPGRDPSARSPGWPRRPRAWASRCCSSAAGCARPTARSASACCASSPAGRRRRGRGRRSADRAAAAARRGRAADRLGAAPRPAAPGRDRQAARAGARGDAAARRTSPPATFVEHDLDDDGRLVAGRSPAGDQPGGDRRRRCPQLHRAPPGGHGAGDAARRSHARARLAGRAGVPADHRRARPRRGARRARSSGSRSPPARRSRWTAAPRTWTGSRRCCGGSSSSRSAGGEINVVVAGINVGAQPYWNAEATMLMHTRGHPRHDARQRDGADRQAGARLLGRRVGRGQLRHRRLRAHHGPQRPGAVLGARPRRRVPHPAAPTTSTPTWRPASASRGARTTSDPARPRRRRRARTPHRVGPRARRRRLLRRDQPRPQEAVRHPLGDARGDRRDHPPLERWAGDARRRDRRRLGRPPRRLAGRADRHRVAPARRATGSSPRTAPSSGRRARCSRARRRRSPARSTRPAGAGPLVVLANLAGFDGSPESMREWQLEFGAEIGRAVVNFDGPIVFCVVSRYHGGAFVVFSQRLNENLEAVALEGAHASVIGGAPAAAVVFARDVEQAARTATRGSSRSTSGSSAAEGAGAPAPARRARGALGSRCSPRSAASSRRSSTRSTASSERVEMGSVSSHHPAGRAAAVPDRGGRARDAADQRRSATTRMTALGLAHALAR